jgi:glucose/arabinose dehydrogenase
MIRPRDASVPLSRRRLFPCGLLAIVTMACGKNTPEPPNVTPAPTENVTGTERLGWTQAAADGREISTFRYAIYVDNARAELAGASCQPPSSSTSASFECSAPLPAMPAGTHTLELATFIVDGATLESARSAPLVVNKTGTAAAKPSGPPATWPNGMTVSTTDGLRLRIERIAEGLVKPTDIAFVPDGRVFVAEQSGRVRVLMPDGRILAEPALSLRRSASDETQLVALAVDPRFVETHFVYTISTAKPGTGRLVFTLARYREAASALVDRIVLRDDILASASHASASLRGGADGKLFVAFDDGGDPRRAGDLASPNGKILRMNPDGTTPADQAGFTPFYSSDVHSPGGFDWRPASNVLWIADRDARSSARLSAVGSAAGAQKRGVRLASYTLPSGTVPSSVAFYRGGLVPTFRNDLLIASEEGRHLLRVRLDPEDQTKVIGTERLFQDAIGGVRVVAVSPAGTIYLATADTLARLVVSQ